MMIITAEIKSRAFYQKNCMEIFENKVFRRGYVDVMVALWACYGFDKGLITECLHG